jgi:hypothetical protein
VPTKEAIELRLVPGFANKEQQMTLLRFALHDGNFQVIAEMNRDAQFEKLTFAIVLNIHSVVREIAVPRTSARWDFAHFHARSHFSELGLNLISIHI